MCMDDIKLFAQNEKELETFIQAEDIYNEDIRQKSENGKWWKEYNYQIKKETYKYLEILEAETIKKGT